MSSKAEVIRGPWGRPEADKEPRAAVRRTGESTRLVLGLVVRECAVLLGHDPSPRELADWANHQRDDRGEFHLFGREISEIEASAILRSPDREVTVRPERALAKPGGGLVGLPR